MDENLIKREANNFCSADLHLGNPRKDYRLIKKQLNDFYLSEDKLIFLNEIKKWCRRELSKDDDDAKTLIAFIDQDIKLLEPIVLDKFYSSL